MCGYGCVSIPSAVTPALQPFGEFQLHFTNILNGPTILQNEDTMKRKTVTEALTNLSLRIFLASHAVSAVSAKNLCRMRVTGKLKGTIRAMEVQSCLFSCILKPLSIICIFPC